MDLRHKQFSSEEEWLAARRAGITGSDIAAIVGAHPYLSPFDIWLNKKGIDPFKGSYTRQRERRAHFARGKALEPVLINLHAAATGAHLIANAYGIFTHPQFPWAIGTPDALSAVDSLGGEYKAPGWRIVREHWTDGIPIEAEVQARWYQFVTDADRWDVVGLLGEEAQLAALTDAEVSAAELIEKGRLRIVPVPRDRELEGLLCERAEQFLVDYVQKDVPPPPQEGELSNWVRVRYPNHNERIVEVADPNIHELAATLLGIGNKLHELTKEKGECEDIFKQMIADSAGLIGVGGPTSWQVTWKKAKDSRAVDAAAALDTLKKSSQEVIRVAAIEAEKAHVVTIPGSRRFLFKSPITTKKEK